MLSIYVVSNVSSTPLIGWWNTDRMQYSGNWYFTMICDRDCECKSLSSFTTNNSAFFNQSSVCPPLMEQIPLPNRYQYLLHVWPLVAALWAPCLLLVWVQGHSICFKQDNYGFRSLMPHLSHHQRRLRCFFQHWHYIIIIFIFFLFIQLP